MILLRFPLKTNYNRYICFCLIDIFINYKNMTDTKKFLLPESEIPTQWYNIQADMKTKPMPFLNPKTHEKLAPEDLYPIFTKACSQQELDQTNAWIPIPDEVREQYKSYRCTPLVRAYALEKALDTPAHIYFKNESVSPVGSHKLNSALAQAWYCKNEGVTNVTTETGAGQWGTALSYACRQFGLELAVYMVKISFEQKPYRRSMMQTFGAQVTPSPSMSTRAGKDILTVDPNCNGSLGTAISEAIELAINTPNCKYCLGSVLNHVSLHQTIIGLEAEKQMEMAEEYVAAHNIDVEWNIPTKSLLVSVAVPILAELLSRSCATTFSKARPQNSLQPNRKHVRNSHEANSNMTSETKADIRPYSRCTQ